MDAMRIKVRGYHLDAYGHVHHARYLEFLEEARWAFFESSVDLAAWERRNIGFFVVHLSIDYRAPAGAGDCLSIHTDLVRIGNKSFTLEQRVLRDSDQTVIAEAEIVACIADRGTQRALPLAGDILESLQARGSSGT